MEQVSAKAKRTLGQRLSNMGPGAIVASAIIGPGTVTTCGMAGYRYGLQLGWAVVLGVIAVILSQLITNRIGIATRQGLAENIRVLFTNKAVLAVVSILLVFSVPGGNIAYQAGNIVGSAVGLGVIFGDQRVLLCIIIGIAAAVLLLSGSLDIVKKFLTGVIFFMVVTFLITAIIVKPDIMEVLRGLIPHVPEGAMIFSMGLVGTTISATNIFLHCSTSASTFGLRATTDEERDEVLEDGKVDIVFSGLMIGVIMICVMIVGNSLAIRGENVGGAADLAKGLEPLAGTFAKFIFGAGIFAAGISSSLTCPMGGAYVVAGLMGFKADLKETKFKIALFVILTAGVLFAIYGGAPTAIILWAQAFNGIFLPITMVILLLVSSKKEIMGRYTDTMGYKIIGIVITAVAIMMSVRTFYNMFIA